MKRSWFNVWHHPEIVSEGPRIKYVNHDCRCFGQDSNRVFAEHESTLPARASLLFVVMLNYNTQLHWLLGGFLNEKGTVTMA